MHIHVHNCLYHNSYPQQGRVLYAHTRSTCDAYILHFGFHLCDDVTSDNTRSFFDAPAECFVTRSNRWDAKGLATINLVVFDQVENRFLPDVPCISFLTSRV